MLLWFLAWELRKSTALFEEGRGRMTDYITVKTEGGLSRACTELIAQGLPGAPFLKLPERESQVG